jgi:hypothetical protein
MLPVLATELGDDPFWSERLERFRGRSGGDHAIHLAVFQEPYLSFMLDGTKTVESRFAVRRFAPYGLVREGDALLLKASSGPVVGVAHVTKAMYYELDELRLAAIRREFGEAIRAEIAGFWDDRREARYATLLEIAEPRVLANPIVCPKRDRRGWVVLRSPERERIGP